MFIDVSSSDHTSKTNVPTTPNGGVEYFGFLDTSTFTSFTITDLSGDNFGMDGISFGFSVPEPSSLPLLGTALFLAGWFLRRRNGSSRQPF